MRFVYLHSPKEIKTAKDLSEMITFDKNLYLWCRSEIVSRKENFQKIFNHLKIVKNDKVCSEMTYFRVTEFERKNSALTKPSRKFDSIIKNYYQDLYNDVLEKEIIYSCFEIPSHVKVNKEFKL